MIVRDSMAYGAWYGGLAGSLVVPITFIVAFFLSGLTSDTAHLVITTDGVEKTIVALLVFGTSGVIAGSVFGFLYGLFLYIVERIFGLEYSETCHQNSYLGFFIFGISIIFAIWAFIESFHDDEAFAFVLFTGWFCWTPLIPVLFLNRKLIQLFE